MIWLDVNLLLVKLIYRIVVVELVDMVMVGFFVFLGSCEWIELVLVRMLDNVVLGFVFNFMVIVMVEWFNMDCDVIKLMLFVCVIVCFKGWVIKFWIKLVLVL